MPDCLKKMLNAITTKSYDFWYYQSLLEYPYVDLLKYSNMIANEMKEEIILSLIKSILELENQNVSIQPYCNQIFQVNDILRST